MYLIRKTNYDCISSGNTLEAVCLLLYCECIWSDQTVKLHIYYESSSTLSGKYCLGHHKLAGVSNRDYNVFSCIWEVNQGS